MTGCKRHVNQRSWELRLSELYPVDSFENQRCAKHTYFSCWMSFDAVLRVHAVYMPLARYYIKSEVNRTVCCFVSC